MLSLNFVFQFQSSMSETALLALFLMDGCQFQTFMDCLQIWQANSLSCQGPGN
jgi:hypothetical protein